MTDQTKIPLGNAKPVKDGDSLFERAEESFNLRNFRPTPPPRNLPPAKPRPQAQAPVYAEQPVAAPVAAPAAAAAPAAMPVESSPKVATAPVESATRVAFSGPHRAVNQMTMRRNGLIESDGPVTALVEEFRIVKRELLGDAREGGNAKARRILVCSPHPGEGKTYCATNLAISMAAERDIEVLLVDADFAKPSIPGLLGIETGKGFMDCLSDPTIAPESLVLSTDIQGLFVLPSGNRTTRDAEYLTSSRTSAVLDRLTAGAPNRIVIFDTPPALAASPAAELAKHVGQALVIVRADVTGQSALEDACQLLSACPDIKLLLNGAHFSPSGRSFGSYAGYGSE